MKRIFLASLMALVFGLFSMPALQAAPANGSAVTSAIKGFSPFQQVRRRRRRRRGGCALVHRRRSRTRLRCR
jgi:hypothetical protein